MKKTCKLWSLLLIIAMLAALVSGCGSPAASSAPAASAEEASETVEAAAPTGKPSANEAAPAEEASSDKGDLAEEAAHVEDISYFPLAEARTVSYWVQLNPEASSLIDNLADTPGYQYLSEKLNVTFDFTCVSNTAATEQFALMIASRDYADILDGIVNVMGGGYTGGPTKAYEDGVIIDLSEYVDEFCPNYMTLLEETDQLRNATTDSGEMLVFYPCYEEFNTLTGVVVREDLLNEFNMDVPETFDDYEEYALAVKSAYDVSDPIYLSSDTNTWVMGYNVTGFAASSTNTGTDHIFVKDGVVTSSFLTEEYKEYLQRMASWYTEGLVSKNFYERSDNIKDSTNETLILSGEICLYPDDANSMLNHEEMNSVEGFDLIGCGWPRLSEDDVVHVSNSLDNLQSMGAACISTCCEDIELVLRFMDSFYTEDAMMLNAFGIPDLYTVADDGTVAYTEEAMDAFENNQWGTTYTNAQGFYRAGIAGMKTQQDQYINWGLESDQTHAVKDIWNSEHYDDAWLIPSTASLTTEESEEVASKCTDIATYAAEKMATFITGETSFDEWDSFVQNLKNMGLQDIIDVYQASVDRYNER